MGSTLGFVKMQCPQLTDAQTQGRCIACFWNVVIPHFLDNTHTHDRHNHYAHQSLSARGPTRNMPIAATTTSSLTGSVCKEVILHVYTVSSIVDAAKRDRNNFQNLPGKTHDNSCDYIGQQKQQ